MSQGTSLLAAQLIEGSKAVAAAGTPLALIANGAKPNATKLTIIAGRPGRVVNTGNVFIGFSVSAQEYTLIPGATLVLDAPQGHAIDLSKIFVDSATNGDGVVYKGTSVSQE